MGTRCTASTPRSACSSRTRPGPSARPLVVDYFHGLLVTLYRVAGGEPQAEVPYITSASVVGETLVVVGGGFDRGAAVLLDDAEQRTKPYAPSPHTALLATRIGATLEPAETVTLRVRNLSGRLSEPFRFTRAFT